MNPNDRWALHASFFSIIIKVEAISRSYAGGKDQFLKCYEADGNGALCRLVAMSMHDVECLLAQLNEHGLVPGVDVGVADMTHGPILPCPGIRFETDNTASDPTWWINAESVLTAERVSSDPASEHRHSIRIAYTYGVCAYNGDRDPVGEHTITVDGATFDRIQAGSSAIVAGQGIQDEGEQLSGDWLFNDPDGSVVFIMEDGEHYEATDIWLDEVLRPRPITPD